MNPAPNRSVPNLLIALACPSPNYRLAQHSGMLSQEAASEEPKFRLAIFKLAPPDIVAKAWLNRRR
jgi:hypothetical protein